MKNTHPIAMCVTWFGCGLSPKAPGTIGSLGALPFVWLCHANGWMLLLGAATIALFFIGVWASNRYMKARGTSADPKEIVVDEVAGQWLLFVAMPLMYLPPSHEHRLALLAAGFVAFRFFDIVKPWPVSWADRKVKGGLGVMLDDVLAALCGVLTLGILGHLAVGLKIITL